MKLKEVNSKSIGKISYYLIVAVLIVIIFGIATFIYVNFVSPKTPVSNLVPVTPANAHSADVQKFNNATRAQDSNSCLALESESSKILCQILKSKVTGNSSYCSTAFDEKLTYAIALKPGETVNLRLSASDYCWYVLSLDRAVGFCDNIKDSRARARCAEEIK